jgi:hypothetical protein
VALGDFRQCRQGCRTDILVRPDGAIDQRRRRRSGHAVDASIAGRHQRHLASLLRQFQRLDDVVQFLGHRLLDHLLAVDQVGDQAGMADVADDRVGFGNRRPGAQAVAQRRIAQVRLLRHAHLMQRAPARRRTTCGTPRPTPVGCEQLPVTDGNLNAERTKAKAAATPSNMCCSGCACSCRRTECTPQARNGADASDQPMAWSTGKNLP